MLVLRLKQGRNHVTLTVPPSKEPTAIRVSVEELECEAAIGFVAPNAVEIMRSDARQSQSRLRARRRTLLRDER